MSAAVPGIGGQCASIGFDQRGGVGLSKQGPRHHNSTPADLQDELGRQEAVKDATATRPGHLEFAVELEVR